MLASLFLGYAYGANRRTKPIAQSVLEVRKFLITLYKSGFRGPESS